MTYEQAESLVREIVEWNGDGINASPQRLKNRHDGWAVQIQTQAPGGEYGPDLWSFEDWYKIRKQMAWTYMREWT